MCGCVGVGMWGCPRPDWLVWGTHCRTCPNEVDEDPGYCSSICGTTTPRYSDATKRVHQAPDTEIYRSAARTRAHPGPNFSVAGLSRITTTPSCVDVLANMPFFGVPVFFKVVLGLVGREMYVCVCSCIHLTVVFSLRKYMECGTVSVSLSWCLSICLGDCLCLSVCLLLPCAGIYNGEDTSLMFHCGTLTGGSRSCL